MDNETKILLMQLTEIHTLEGRSKLDNLCNSIMNTHPVIPIQDDGPHSIFKLLLQSCSIMQKDAALHDFSQFMTLFQLSSYISRWDYLFWQ